MHSFLLRIREEVFNHAKVEAETRGISINDFLTYCIEIAIAELMSESAEAFKEMIKSEAIRKERERLRNE